MSRALVVYCRRKGSRRWGDYGVFAEQNRTRRSLEKENVDADSGYEILAYIPIDENDPGIRALVSALDDDLERYMCSAERPPHDTPLQIALRRLIVAVRTPQKGRKKK